MSGSCISASSTTDGAIKNLYESLLILLVPSSICYFLTDLVLLWVDVIETVLMIGTTSSYLTNSS